MPLSQFVVDGIDALKQKLSSVGAKQTFIMFTGSKTNGKSWCPDCVTAEPVVEKVLSKPDVKELDAVFITCLVGQRDYWKSPDCPFRTDPDFKLKCIPTIIEYKKNRRIQDDQCANEHVLTDLLLE